jgi:hypothetical protein
MVITKNQEHNQQTPIIYSYNAARTQPFFEFILRND